MTFQIHGLPADTLQSLFDLSEQELTKQGARKVKADKPHAFPCRIGLRDADVGEELILANYAHLKGSTPYAATHAIYVAKDAKEAKLSPGEVPDVMARRLLSVRGLSQEKMILDADVIEGTELAATLDRLFANEEIESVDIHNAARGCFAGTARRSDDPTS